MVDDDAIVIGGLILLAMLTNKRTVEWGTGWVWPVPDLRHPDGSISKAVVSQEYRGSADHNPHFGVDVMFRDEHPPPTFTAPEGTPIVSARDGSLWAVDRTARGWYVVVDHGPPWATYYQHLATIDPTIASGLQGRNVPTGSGKRPLPIRAGQQLGTMGSDPTDAGHVRHLHFAVWHQGAGNKSSIDPAPDMGNWGRMVMPWTV